ncbi:MAG: hypothetical protein ACXABY_30515 [Candidatus Thorarchaeota archaeon]|jgi:hypothetical protein
MQEYVKDILRYYRLILKIGIEHADKWDFVVAFILALVVLIAGIIGHKIAPGTMWWLYAILLALLFDFVVIIPTRIGVRYIRSTIPRLKVYCNVGENDRGDFWISLKVVNPTVNPIHQCYGQVIRWKVLHADTESTLPLQTTSYPWSSRTGSQEPEYERTIGAGSEDILDLVRSPKDKPLIFESVRALDRFGTRRDHHFDWPMGAGEYEAIVEIGSRNISLRPTYISVKMRLNIDDERAVVNIKEVKHDYFTNDS